MPMLMRADSAYTSSSVRTKTQEQQSTVDHHMPNALQETLCKGTMHTACINVPVKIYLLLGLIEGSTWT